MELYPSTLHVKIGTVGGGKTDKLNYEIEPFHHGQDPYAIFKPEISLRGESRDESRSRRGSRLRGITLHQSTPHRMLEHITKDMKVVGIDEYHMWDRAVDEVVEYLLETGRMVLAATLNGDYGGEPFPGTSFLLTRARSIEYFLGNCDLCGKPGEMNQAFLPDGSLLPYNKQDNIKAGDLKAKKSSGQKPRFQARCTAHWKAPPGSPYKREKSNLLTMGLKAATKEELEAELARRPA